MRKKIFNKVFPLFLVICIVLTMMPIYAKSTVELSVETKEVPFSTADRVVEVAISISGTPDTYGAFSFAMFYDDTKLSVPTTSATSSNLNKSKLSLNSDITSNYGTVTATVKTIGGKKAIYLSVLDSDSNGGTQFAGRVMTIPFTVAGGVTGDLEFKFDTSEANTVIDNNTFSLVNGKISVATPSSDLSSITVPGYTLNPTFSATTTQYAIEIPYGAAAPTNVTASAADPAATVDVVQASLANGNKATISVTSQVGIKTYEIKFNNAAPSNDATLKSITVNGTKYTSITDINDYTIPYTTVVPTVTCETNDATATAEVVPATSVRGITVINVTAQDGTKKSYEVKFSLENNTANDITSFSVPNMIGTATIDASNGTVTASVPFGTDRKAMVATFDVSPEATASPASGSEFNFETDQIITVKAQDGTERPWTVTVSEGAPIEAQSVTIAGDNTITTNGGTATYTATVLPSNSSFKTVTWSIDNTAVASINATTGELTAKQNGTVIITATVVGRISIKSSKSVTISGQTVEGLSDLKVEGVTLDSFAPDTYNYTLPVVATAASITIVPTAGAGETVTINGNAVAPSYALKPGSNLFTIVVSAQGKNSKTYTLTVDREYPYSSTADLEYSPSIFVNGRVTNGLTSNETAYVIVKLMKDGAVLDVVENKVTLDAKGSADYAVRFNKYSGTGYTVKVFVRDTMTNASAGDTVGMDMARPTDATQKK